MDGTTTGEVIDAMVLALFGESLSRDAELYRTNLSVLVQLAKAEQRAESEHDLAMRALHFAAGVVH